MFEYLANWYLGNLQGIALWVMGVTFFVVLYGKLRNEKFKNVGAGEVLHHLADTVLRSGETIFFTYALVLVIGGLRPVQFSTWFAKRGDDLDLTLAFLVAAVFLGAIGWMGALGKLHRWPDPQDPMPET